MNGKFMEMVKYFNPDYSLRDIWLSDFEQYLNIFFQRYEQKQDVFGMLFQRMQNNQPKCFEALELKRGCTVDDIKSAYRRKAKSVHPDHGGSEAAFIELQGYYEQALTLAGN